MLSSIFIKLLERIINVWRQFEAVNVYKCRSLMGALDLLCKNEKREELMQPKETKLALNKLYKLSKPPFFYVSLFVLAVVLCHVNI